MCRDVLISETHWPASLGLVRDTLSLNLGRGVWGDGSEVKQRLSESGLLRANILFWASDGECSQLLCWPLMPCPNSWGHFISVTGCAGLEPISSHSDCVFSVKFLCAEYHEYWCEIEQCVR